MIDGPVALNYYIACMLHYFNVKYNMYDYDFQTKLTKKAFEEHKDKNFYYVIGKKILNIQELISFYTSYFIKFGKVHISKMLGDDYKTFYDHLKLLDNFSSYINDDLEKLSNMKKELNIKSYINPQETSTPFLYDSLLNKKTKPETVVFFDIYFKGRVFEKWSSINNEKFINILNVLKKYKYYIQENVDMEKSNKIFSKWLQNQLLI